MLEEESERLLGKDDFPVTQCDILIHAVHLWLDKRNEQRNAMSPLMSAILIQGVWKHPIYATVYPYIILTEFCGNTMYILI